MSIRIALRSAAAAAVAFTVASSALPAPLSAQATGTFQVSGDRVEIYNLAGIILLQPGRGSAVVVDIDAGGADAGQLDVDIGRIGGAEALRVRYPDDRIVYPDMSRGSRTQIRVRPDGTFFGSGSRRGDQVTISGSGRGLEAYADMTISVPAGKRVGVYLGVGEVEVRNVDGALEIDVASAPVTSRDTRGDLSIDTGSGSVDVTNAGGDVSIDTGSGAVTVSGVIGGSLLVDTGSGGVTGGDVQVREMNIDTGSGRINLDRVTAPIVRLDTGSGSVSVDLMVDVEDLYIDTGSGSVTVMIPDDLGADLAIETGSGGIDFEMPVTVRRFNRSELYGSVGDGQGRIRVDTGSGSVRFLRR
jgi:lia operon protein LiaG